MAEGVEHLQNELIFEGQAEEIHATDCLGLGEFERVCRNLDRQPKAGFPEGEMKINLALAL